MSLKPHADEYIDYSCSTCIERLARDLETILSSWHLGDRHVKGLTNKLRSSQLQWNILIYLDSVTIDTAIDLDLTLYDGEARDEQYESDRPSNNREEMLSLDHLPLSLRRLPVRGMPDFQNFGSLFGIGQHLVLSPLDTTLDASLARYLKASVLSRHHVQNAAPLTFHCVLTQWLQTALNIAVTQIHCTIPAFGIWGNYSSFSSSDWIPGLSHMPEHPGQFLRARGYPYYRTNDRYLNQQLLPPILCGQVLGDPFARATFWCSVMPGPPPPDARLTVWGDILLRHCPDEEVALWGAKHTYVWKRRPSLDHHDWRRSSNEMTVVDLTLDDIDTYRRQCQEVGLALLEDVSGSSPQDPFWGSTCDPIASLSLEITWEPQINDHGNMQPLLKFPLKVRSQESFSEDDIIETELSIEYSLLDPHNASKASLRVQYDHESPQQSLAATQRCVLAALIRTATLPPETMLSHLLDDSIIDGWDKAAGNAIADRIADLARVGTITRALVAALDWQYAEEHTISSYVAEELLGNVFQKASFTEFPSPPENSTDSELADCALKKAAPVGRLLSLLCSAMARVRSPSSMILVWTSFVSELRQRWDARESIPNMAYIPGLDPRPEGSKNCFSVVGSKVNFSAQVHNCHPDPDDYHCLIGQKLQVFNLCIEALVTSELRKAEMIERRQRNEAMKASSFLASPDSNSSSPAFISVPSKRVRMTGTEETEESMDTDGVNLSLDDAGSEIQSNMSKTGTFVDAEEDHSLDFTKQGDDSDADLMRDRPGARQPVQGHFIKQSGLQVFAPYLQRAYPLTDDIVAQRRFMLIQQRFSGHARRSEKEQDDDQLEIVFRLQRSKLFSDMSAFKAANPGAEFDDFLNWYGPPRNPLRESQEYDSQAVRLGVDIQKLVRDPHLNERAILETLSFWHKVWTEASPVPAVDQESLFDPVAKVEEALDYLETLHPASLICQVLAVSLSNSYFALVAASRELRHKEPVRTVLDLLREAVDSALQQLSLDTTMSQSRSLDENGRASATIASVVSIDSIFACEKACDLIGNAEILIARSLSLNSKFSEHVDLVETLMVSKEGDCIPFDSPDVNKDFLRQIRRQQDILSHTKNNRNAPVPLRREYLLRNTDEATPCQLAVLYGDDVLKKRHKTAGGIVLAIAKTSKEKLNI